MKYSQSAGLLLALAVLGSACAAPMAPTGDTSGASPAPVKKRIVSAVLVEPDGWHQRITQRVSAKGFPETEQLLNATLAYSDDEDVLQPHLAEAVPSVENGMWQVHPDGRMETTWRIKPGVVWQDGTPFTAADLLFTAQVIRDPEVEAIVPATLQLVDSLEAVDPLTLLVTWRSVFIEADTLFSPGLLMPMARHILEPTYQQDKSRVLTHAYWRDAFIGTGPFRLVEWLPGSHVLLRANDQYVLGRPRIDEIEVKFIPDYSIMTANVMAGTVEKLMGVSLPAAQGVELRNTAPAINTLLAERLGNVLPIYPQFLNSDPPLVANLEFRRALYQAIDRQEMNDTLNHGIGPIAHTWLQPDRVEYQAIASRVVQYEYDPRRAAQNMESLSLTRGADGRLRDGTGPLRIEMRTNDREPIHMPAGLAVADYWKRLGIETELTNIPLQRVSDAEYRSTFPAFEISLTSQTLSPADVRRGRSSATPLPENGFQGQNRTRYRNAAYDSYIDRYVSTVPKTERMLALGDIIHQQTDQVVIMPQVYNAVASVLGSKRLKNVASSKNWNAHLWDFD